MKKEMKLQPTEGLLEALSHNLYDSVDAEVGELIFNAMDAATLANRDPIIQVKIWQAGEHPLSKGPALSVLDNGVGFTDEVSERYCRLGESFWVHHKQGGMHGRHGVGKLSAMALGVGPYYIITRSVHGSGIKMVRLSKSSMTTGAKWQEVAAGRFLHLPEVETFSEIFVPDFRGGVTPEELQQQLTLRLPVTQSWQISVNGQPVQRRHFSAQVNFVSEDVPILGGQVEIQLGVLEQDSTNQDDGVWLVDKRLGRLVARMGDVRRAAGIGGAICHPSLVGTVAVHGLAEVSTTNRGGIKAGFWTTPRGEALHDAIMLWGNEQAAKVLGEELPGNKNSMLLDSLQPHLSLFEQAFGSPSPQQQEQPSATERPRHREGLRSSVAPTVERKPREPRAPRTEEEKRPQLPTQPRMRIEGLTYDLWSYVTTTDLPAEVRPGNTMVLNLGHPEVKRLLSRRQSAPLTFRDALVRWLIEAHVVENNDGSTPPFKRVYDLMARVIPNK